MRAEIKSYHADENVGDPLTYQSRDADAFGYALTFSIGPVGQEGADNFEVIVTTPKDLQTEYAGRTPTFLRHCMLVDNYDFTQVFRLMTNYVNSLEAESWEKLVEKLSRVALWEFEDYRP